MSRVGALAEHVKRVAEQVRQENPSATVIDLIARLAEHAEDAAILDQEALLREDHSKGVGA